MHGSLENDSYKLGRLYKQMLVRPVCYGTYETGINEEVKWPIGKGKKRYHEQDLDNDADGDIDISSEDSDLPVSGEVKNNL